MTTDHWGDDFGSAPTDERRCARCGVSDEVEMLCARGLQLVCGGCDSDLEREWVDEDPGNNRHYLDTFSPTGD